VIVVDDSDDAELAELAELAALLRERNALDALGNPITL